MPEPGRRTRPGGWPLWVRIGLPLVVLGLALAIGSGAFSGRPETALQRAQHIEAVVRCPSCVDVSVLQSQESTAIAVRHQIQGMVDRGDSTGDIEATLVSQYGQTILLVPPDSGGFSLVWIVPSVLAAGALVAVGVFFYRRSRQFAATGAAQAGRASP